MATPDISQYILRDALTFGDEPSNTFDAVHGTISFAPDDFNRIQPYIKYQRDRRANSTSSEMLEFVLWAPEIKVDQEKLYENFGYPIQVRQAVNSEEYKNVLQGLWSAYWAGPAIDKVIQAVNIIFNLPFAPADGVVTNLSVPDPAFVLGTVSPGAQVVYAYGTAGEITTPNTFVDTAASYTFTGVDVGRTLYLISGSQPIPELRAYKIKAVPAVDTVELEDFDGTVVVLSSSLTNDIEWQVRSTTTFNTSALNPLGNSSRLAFTVDYNPPTIVFFPDSIATHALDVVDAINDALPTPTAELIPATGQVKIGGLASVKIDTVLGNPGLGFEPGIEDFGTYEVSFKYDDGTEEILNFESQYGIAIAIGDRVSKFDPLTTAVGVFDYIALPKWWELFGILKLDASVTTYSQEDKDILNDIQKDFLFTVRILSDSFARLGDVDRSILRFFLEEIKPTITDFILIVAERIFEIVSCTDNKLLLELTPSPSENYIEQRGNQVDTLKLSVFINNYTDIYANYPNFNILDVPTNPNPLYLPSAFQTGHHAADYDGARIESEDVTVIDQLTITVTP